jgi:hypothetical protein
MTDPQKLSKVELTILEVKEPIKVGDKGFEKLQFKARNAEGKEGNFFTFTKNLFDSIKEGKEIQADVEVTTTQQDDRTYINRKVTQVYIDGKPVSEKKEWQGKQGFGGHSIEERGSIEAQTAFKGVIELMVAGKVLLTDSLGRLAYNWATKHLTENPIVKVAIEQGAKIGDTAK